MSHPVDSRRDRVVVVLEYKIYVYNFSDLKLVDHIETTSNTKGLCELCPYSSNTVLVCPGLQVCTACCLHLVTYDFFPPSHFLYTRIIYIILIVCPDTCQST